MKKCLPMFLATICVLTSCSLTHVGQTPSDRVTQVDVSTLSEDSFSPDSGNHSLRIFFVNAGKADCILLEADGMAYMIDTGAAHSVPKILAAMEWMGIETLSGVFLTHTDKDHIGGWYGITKTYLPEKLYTAAINEAPAIYESLADGISYETVLPGQSVPIGTDGLYLDVLGPIRLFPEEENNNSLVLRLDCGAETILFTGDVRAEGEADLLSSGYSLDCTILKVPYHGRKDASKQAFLEAAAPEISIICTDTETDPDTAHEDVLERLAAYGEVYCTEEAGLGWLLTIEETGERTLENIPIPAEPTHKLAITDVSIHNQTVTIRNDGPEADLAGCILYSDRGDELYFFTDGTILGEGERITIGCAGSGADLIWTGETSVWHKSKKDNAVLYDRWGNVLDTKKAE